MIFNIGNKRNEWILKIKIKMYIGGWIDNETKITGWRNWVNEMYVPGLHIEWNERMKTRMNEWIQGWI